MTSEARSHIRCLHSRHRQYQQITEDCRAMGHIVLLAYHLRRTAESHHVLGFHCRRLHSHSHRRDLRLTTISTAVKQINSVYSLSDRGRLSRLGQ